MTQTDLLPWERGERILPSNQTLSGVLQQIRYQPPQLYQVLYRHDRYSRAFPPRYEAQVAAALEKARKPVLVWLQFQDRAGNSESMLRSSHLPVLHVVLDLLCLKS